MSTGTPPNDEQAPAERAAVIALYQQLLDAWDGQRAADYAALFAPGGHVIGFDGSLMDGPDEIEATLAGIFAHHRTAPYVGKLRDVEFLAPDVALLRAIVGMVPPGQHDLNPSVNAIQTLIARRQGGRWRIVLFQNTPAAFHGRPELVEQMTDELREVLHERGGS